MLKLNLNAFAFNRITKSQSHIHIFAINKFYHSKNEKSAEQQRNELNKAIQYRNAKHIEYNRNKFDKVTQYSNKEHIKQYQKKLQYINKQLCANPFKYHSVSTLLGIATGVIIAFFCKHECECCLIKS